MKEIRKTLSKKVVALMLVVAMIAAYLPANVAEAAANLLTNGDFETTSQDVWKYADDSSVPAQTVVDKVNVEHFYTGGDFENGNPAGYFPTVAVDPADAANQCLALSDGTEYGPNFPVTAGETYTLRFRIKTSETQANWACRTADAVSNNSTTQWRIHPSYTQDIYKISTNVWQDIEAQFTVASGRGTVALRFTNLSSGSGAIVYIDDITLTQESKTEAYDEIYTYNSGFESGDPAWSYGGTVVADTVESGNHCVQLSITEASHVKFPATAGETYKLRFRLRASLADTSWNAYAVEGEENGAGNGRFRVYGNTSSSNTPNYGPAGTAWQIIEEDITVKSGQSQIALVFNGQNVSNGATLYVDDVSLYQLERCMDTEETYAYDNDFEGEVAWSHGGTTIADPDGSSNHCVELQQTGSDNIKFQNVVAGEKYILRFRVKAAADGTTWNCYSTQGVANADNRTDRFRVYGNGNASDKPNYGAAGTVWQTVEEEFEVASGQTGITLVFNNVGTGKKLYIDDVALFQATEQPAFEKTYTEGLGKCMNTESSNVLAMVEEESVTQTVTLSAGTTYEYSMKVKSVDAASGLTFGLQAGSTTQAVTVTDTWETVTGEITPTAAATSFGFYKDGVGTVLVDDVVLTQNAVAVPVTDHTPSLEDGYFPTKFLAKTDFSDFPNGYVYNSNSSQVEKTSENVAKLSINAANNYIHTGSFAQVQGNSYTMKFYVWVESADGLSFDVRNTQGGGIASSYMLHDNLLTNAGTKFTAKVNGVASSSSISSVAQEWQLVEITWVAENSDNIRMVLRGSGSGVVYVDDLVIYDSTPPFVAEDHTPSVPEGYYPSTPLVQTEFADTTEMNNGAFYFAGSSLATITENKVAKLTIDRASVTNFAWSGGFSQVQGHTYKMSFYALVKDASTLSFDVRSTASAIETIEHDNLLATGAGTKFTAKVNGVVSSAALTANTAEWQLIEITWTATSNDNIRMVLTGNGKGTVYVDDVVVYDTTPPAKGVAAEIQFKSFTRSATQYTLVFTGTYPTNTNGWRGRSNVKISINGKEFTQMFIHEANETLVAYIPINDTTRLNEDVVNTIIIPADSDFYMNNNNVSDTSTPEFYIENDYIIYSEHADGHWLDYTTEHTYVAGQDVQYEDMGTGKEYLFSNTTDTAHDGVAGTIVVKKDNVVVYESDNKTDAATGAEYHVSYATKELGDYSVIRTAVSEKFEYQVALYKRGNASAELSAGETVDVLDSRDLVAIKKSIANGVSVGNAQWKASDANADGTVDSKDAGFMREALTNDYDLMSTQKGETILDQGTMPIIAFGGPNQKDSAALCTQDVYNLIKDMGFNTVVSTATTRNSAEYLTDGAPALKMAEKANLKLYIQDSYISNMTDNKTVTPDILAQRSGQSNMYNSFAGIFVKDEPFLNNTGNTSILGNGTAVQPLSYFASALENLNAYTNVHGYLNLFPYDSGALNNDLGGSWTGKASYANYKKYVDKAAELGAEQISYDLYYIDNNGGDVKDEEFYTNLGYVREFSASNNLPFKAYVQAGTDFGTNTTSNSKLPTKAVMYLEANAALTMGAKGLSYFRLIRNADYDSTNNCLIDRNGNAVTNTSLGENYNYYAGAKRINSYIAAIDHILMNSTSKGVVATNSKIAGWIGTASSKTASDIGLYAVSGEHAFVGGFDYYGRSVYMVTNTSTTAQTTITLTFNGATTYTTTDMNLTTGGATASSVAITVPAGESVLVVCEK